VRHATRVYTAIATDVSWLTIWPREAVNPVRKINTFFTFKRSIIGRKKHTTYLNPPLLSAADSIFFLPKMITNKTVCDITDAVV
jgi:hypothetical protein